MERNPRFAAEAAQLQAYAYFSADFKSRYPGGDTISELEYAGEGLYFIWQEQSPTYRSVRSSRHITEIYRGLSQDFRRGWKSGDFRKPDGLGVDARATVAELLEVTTWNNRASAIRQMQEKLRLFHEVKTIHSDSMTWRNIFARGTPWKPAKAARYSILADTPAYIDYICYEPTFRPLPEGGTLPDGVILYEVHRIQKPKPQPDPVPVPVPDKVKDALREAAKSRQQSQLPVESWAETFLGENAWVRTAIKALCLVAGAAMAIVAIIAVFDPVPGDEVAAMSMAMALVKVATR